MRKEKRRNCRSEAHARRIGGLRGGTARFGFAAMIAVALAAGLTVSARADEPYGTWLRPSTGTQVNFYNCGGKLCAKIVAVKDQSRKGEIGTLIMNGAGKSSDNEWRGDLLNTEDGKTYSGVVTLEGPNALNLKGCVAAIFCKGETWQRVK
jgi:uncharacterized protein (DUF2147 family)